MKDIINARCSWAGTDELYIKYHDEEWGRPVSDDKTLFEFLVLESAQAGLSWLTILRKREGYRRAFHGFDVEKVARMTAKDVERLMRFDGIVKIMRNCLWPFRKNSAVFTGTSCRFSPIISPLLTISGLWLKFPLFLRSRKP